MGNTSGNSERPTNSSFLDNGAIYAEGYYRRNGEASDELNFMRDFFSIRDRYLHTTSRELFEGAIANGNSKLQGNINIRSTN